LDPGCSDWWDAAFRSRVRLDFDNSTRQQNLQNFPVRVSLDATRIDYAKTQDAGQDLRFVDADGATVLAHEIEVWDETGTSEVWVRVPQIDELSASDFIWMYFDNAAAPDGQNPSLVWDPDHVAVFHLGEPDTGGVVSDSSSGVNHGTVFNGAIFGSTGKIGKAIAFDGVDDYASLGNTGFNPAAGTVEAWVYIDTLPAVVRGYIFSHFTPAPTSNRIYVFVRPDQLWGTGMGSTFDLVTGSALVTGEWIYLVLAWDGTNVSGYKNGLLDFGSTPYADLTTVGDIRAMSWNGADEFTDGTLDELRISRTFRSEHWISAQHSSIMDTFIAYGSIQAAP
jgi:biopolymer transport protein ExbB